jgi:uncharacterized protein (DUF2236 family)
MGDGREPLFPQDAAIRRIGGESALMLAAGRALLMQVAHPLVAAGVADHSGFTEDPWRRLARTMQAVYAVVYGTREQAERIRRGVAAAHGHVRGALREHVGPFAAGTPYAADDPALTLWVHATLVDTALEVYSRFVGPVSDADRAEFYEQMTTVADVFGVPAAVIPPDPAAFGVYVANMLSSGDLAVGGQARAIARTVLDPPVPLPLKPTFIAMAHVTAALLPEPLPALYGLRAGRAERLLARSSAAVSRRVVPRVPGSLRVVGPSGRRSRPGLALRVLDAMAR